MKNQNKKSVIAGRSNHFHTAFLIFMFFAWSFNQFTSFASPFRAKPSPQVGFFDAAGINGFCGAQDVVLNAIGDMFILPGHTFTYQWEAYATDIWPNGWYGYYSNTAKTVTVSITSAPKSIKIRCQVQEFASGSLVKEWTTGVAELRFAASSPSISQHPSNLTICEGAAASFSSSASGSYVEYQWYEITAGGSSSLITGATSTTYALSPNPPVSKNSYRYKCYATNGCGTATSNEATLTVNIPPSITNPSNVSVCQDLPASFSITSSNATSLQWQYLAPGGNWTNCSSAPYSGFNSKDLSISQAVNALNGYSYRCTASGSCSPVATSASATLTVEPNPAITLNQTDQTVCEGQNVTFTITATGNNLNYSWEKKIPGDIFRVIQGASSNSYSHLSAAGENGNYYKCKVFNNCNSAYSSEASGKLTVNTAPVLNSISADISVCEGLAVPPSFTASFSTNVSNVNFEKSENSGQSWSSVLSADPGGAGSISYTLPSADYSLNGFLYRVTVSGICAPSVTSATRSVTIKKQPAITVNPANVTACIGASASLSVTATGSGLEYKWRRAGATYLDWSSTKELIIPSITSGDATQWDVLVRNECSDQAGIDSDDATITVYPKPNIELGNDKKICEGSSAVLNAGFGFKSYSWNTGETTRTITVGTQGAYTATVTDNNNCSASDIISVFVDPPLPVIQLGNDTVLCKGETIVLDASENYDSYVWNTGSDLQNISITVSGKYYVTAGWNSSLCKASDTINILFAAPYENEEICMVMIDPETEKNMIIWEKTPDVGTEKYQVWKVSGSDYSLVTETMEIESSIIIDSNSKPDTKTDAYVLVSIDTCGNASQKSSWHKPFLLQSSVGLNDVINLSWEPYLVNGEEYIFKSIVIYRSTDPTILVPIDKIEAGIGSTSYIDQNPPPNVNLYYRIGGEKEVPCNPNNISVRKTSSGPFVHSLSNLEDNRLYAPGIRNFVETDNIGIYPNPLKTESELSWNNPNGSNFDLFIYDLKGVLIRSVTGLHKEKYLLHRENLPTGCFIIEIKGNRTFRGRLLVE